ncbi:hypothetical protein CHUAL_013881 [Chamberlinius hualienensis]
MDHLPIHETEITLSIMKEGMARSQMQAHSLFPYSQLATLQDPFNSPSTRIYSLLKPLNTVTGKLELINLRKDIDHIKNGFINVSDYLFNLNFFLKALADFSQRDLNS